MSAGGAGGFACRRGTNALAGPLVVPHGICPTDWLAGRPEMAFHDTNETRRLVNESVTCNYGRILDAERMCSTAVDFRRSAAFVLPLVFAKQWNIHAPDDDRPAEFHPLGRIDSHTIYHPGCAWAESSQE
jgi:hypothetical protein